METKMQTPLHPLAEYIERLEQGDALLKDSTINLIEVVGILKSYGVVLDAYSNNLNSIAKREFLNIFPFFKYFNGQVSPAKLWKHWCHDRINYEYAEYCMKTMFWHGGGGLDEYLDSQDFRQVAQQIIAKKFKSNPLMLLVDRVFPEFLPEQLRLMAYYRGLGDFWRVMSDIFISLSDRYDRGEITSINSVVQHIQDGLVESANRPFSYEVELSGVTFEVIPACAGLIFIKDLAVPYVEAVFFRGGPFPGTVSYNAQAYQIPNDQGSFTYGALYADPLPIGGPGIPPTQLMQDMRHFLPPYLNKFYHDSFRQQEDILVQICQSFQKSMFCVTTATIKGLAPFPLSTQDPQEQKTNRTYLISWLNRFKNSRLEDINSP